MSQSAHRPKVRLTLPEAADAVTVEHGFVRHEDEIGERRLGDQHPIEWVAMRTWQVSGRLTVVHRDRQLEKALSCKRAGNIVRERCRLG